MSEVVEVILDASQIETFEACEYKWHFDHERNLTTPHPNPALSTGSYFHECLKFYYSQPQPLGNHIKPALEYARKLAIDPGHNRKWPEVRKDPKFYWERFRAYIFNWLHEDEQIEIIAVEKGFSYLLYEDTERRYILEGIIDLVAVKPRQGLVVIDHKTQSRFYDKYDFSHQPLNYFNFCQPDYFEYNYIGLQDNISDNTFRRDIVKYGPGVLEQWKRDVFKTFQHFEECQRKKNYPRRRAACKGQFGLCQFHRRCEVPDDSPLVQVIESYYVQKEQKWRAWG